MKVQVISTASTVYIFCLGKHEKKFKQTIFIFKHTDNIVIMFDASQL